MSEPVPSGRWRAWQERFGPPLVTGLAQVARHLSAREAEALGRALGAARYATRPAEREVVRVNLARLHLTGNTPGEIDPVRLTTLVGATFRAFGLFCAEFFRGLTLAPSTLAAHWEVSGWHHLQRAARSPRGFILAGAHTGNWEQLGAIAPLLGRRIVAPVGEQFSPALSAAVKRAKRRSGVDSVSPVESLRDLLRALDRGDLVAIPLDGGAYRRGVPVELLGQRVWLAAGAARLATLGACPIVPVFSRRIGFMQQAVRVLAPLHASMPGRARCGAPRYHELAQRLADLLGEHLRAAAGEWCIFRHLAWYHEDGLSAPAEGHHAFGFESATRDLSS